MEELRRAKENLIDIYVRTTQQPRDVIAARMDRDFWLTAGEAVAFGVVDTVVRERAPPAPDAAAPA